MHEGMLRAPIGMLDVARDGTVRAINRSAATLFEVDRENATDAQIDRIFPDSVDAQVPRAFNNPPTEAQQFEEYYPAIDRWLETQVVPSKETVYLYVQDVTDRHRREARIGELDDALDRMTAIDGLISAILADLIAASGREEIAETVCRRLGETPLSAFAWVGERELGSDRITIRAAAGQTGRTFEAIESCLATEPDVPEARVIASGEPAIIQPIGEDKEVPESIRRAAFADGLQSLLAIPLTYGSSVYGVVGVYSADREAFTERERASFGTVGEIAGFAVNASRHRNILLSDTVVELTIEVTDPADPFCAVAQQLEAGIHLNGVVPGTDQILCYCRADGADPDSLVAHLDSRESVAAARVITSLSDGGTFESEVSTQSLIGRVTLRGATIQAARYDEDGGELVVEITPEEDVRRFAEAITRGRQAEIVAKHECERDVLTAAEFREALRDQLTDRQEQVLKTAYFANYFESPRGSNAEEVAEALDITGPTLLHHLRAAQRKLLGSFFPSTEHSLATTDE